MTLEMTLAAITNSDVASLVGVATIILAVCGYFARAIARSRENERELYRLVNAKLDVNVANERRKELCNKFETIERHVAKIDNSITRIETLLIGVDGNNGLRSRLQRVEDKVRGDLGGR